MGQRGTLMTDKAKRKVSPRRRLLFRLIFGIGVLVALIASGVYLLRPTGAQIVFIAPDDEGINQIWIAEVNNPENPRQLTFRDTGNIAGLAIPETGDLFVYSPCMTEGCEIWTYNLSTNQNTLILSCENYCWRYDLHPNGQLLTYEQHIDETWSIEIHVYDLQSGVNHLIYKEDYLDIVSSRNPQWVGRSNQVAFHGGDGTIFYDYENHTSETRNLYNFRTGAPYPPRMYFPEARNYYAFSPSGASHIIVRQIDSPDEDYFVLSLSSDDPDGSFYLNDWDTNNHAILVFEDRSYGHELNLYEIETGEKINLLNNNNEFLYRTAQFNYDSSQILYYVEDADDVQIMLYNMETDEEITLPLFGHNPHWVNGGR